MPSASDADNPHGRLPPDLQEDYQSFTTVLARLAHGPEGNGPIGDLLDDGQALEKLIRFAIVLHQQSDRLSLVARRDRSRIFTRHILDSLAPLSLLGQRPARLLDIGSGAGFPGIPLAISWPRTEVTLLESRGKKAGFLERAVREIPCVNARVVCGRLEEAGTAWRAEPFDAITVRAVGGLREILPEASRVAAPRATWIYFLGDVARADAVLHSLDTSAFDPAVRQGVTGGWVIMGRFMLDKL